MAVSKLARVARYPRTQIPKFTATEITRANLCAQALWYGINFDTGNKQLSDADLMSFLAKYFYTYQRTKKRANPDIFEKEIKLLINTCGLAIMYRSLAKMDIKKGIDAMYNDVYPIYKKSLKNPNRTSTYIEAMDCLWKLSKGFIINPKYNCLGLSSRIMFFLSPNLRTFNMNREIAIRYGLQVNPAVHYPAYFELFNTGLITNRAQLTRHKMPPMRGALDMKTWQTAARTDWWERRVLDIAVLLRLSGNMPYPNLRHLINEQIKEDAKS
jgi:hypothetical protein